jgi:methyl coenzyme M reductase subunit C
VDLSTGRRHGEEPGADIALQLARHGVHLNVERVMSNGSPIPEVTIAHEGEPGYTALSDQSANGSANLALPPAPV